MRAMMVMRMMCEVTREGCCSAPRTFRESCLPEVCTKRERNASAMSTCRPTRTHSCINNKLLSFNSQDTLHSVVRHRLHVQFERHEYSKQQQRQAVAHAIKLRKDEYKSVDKTARSFPIPRPRVHEACHAAKCRKHYSIRALSRSILALRG
jgi:hypothetical protein